MATEILITVTKDSSTRKFIFETGETKSLGKQTVSQTASLDFIQEDIYSSATEPFVISLGKSTNIAIEFKFYAQTLDRSDGTGILAEAHTGSTIKTYAQILNYLEETIFFPDAGQTQYLIAITDKFRTASFYCSLEDFNINVDSGLRPTGNAKFKVLRKVV